MIFYRVLSALIVMLGVSTITFALLHAVPGDPVEVMLGESASVADRAALRADLGLDQPIPQQWLAFQRDLVRLDFGQSLYSKKTHRRSIGGTGAVDGWTCVRQPSYRTFNRYSTGYHCCSQGWNWFRRAIFFAFSTWGVCAEFLIWPAVDYHLFDLARMVSH